KTIGKKTYLVCEGNKFSLQDNFSARYTYVLGKALMLASKIKNQYDNCKLCHDGYNSTKISLKSTCRFQLSVKYVEHSDNYDCEIFKYVGHAYSYLIQFSGSFEEAASKCVECLTKLIEIKPITTIEAKILQSSKKFYNADLIREVEVIGMASLDNNGKVTKNDDGEWIYINALLGLPFQVEKTIGLIYNGKQLYATSTTIPSARIIDYPYAHTLTNNDLKFLEQILIKAL
ncbi:MAG: hypothetical protein ACOC80_09005, partial [Petrotogales bacterium]